MNHYPYLLDLFKPCLNQGFNEYVSQSHLTLLRLYPMETSGNA